VSVTRHLVKQLRGFQQVITHAYEGGHPDHDSTAFCVHAACALIQRSGEVPPTIMETPLYNAPGGRYVHQVFLPHADAGPILSMPLSEEQKILKRRMYACHESQGKTFDDFHVEKEQFRVAPRYHFCAPPHSGDVGYNQFGWPLNGKVWRRRAWKAVRELDLLELA
jgi:LmbE family N-acetylglucosaminyl deacetylase